MTTIQYSTYENYPVRIIELSKFILERHKGDPYFEERALTDWVGALVTQGKLEAASKMLDETKIISNIAT